MSPQLKKFNKDSIIFFTGDLDHHIYILKEGKVIVSHTPPDKLEEVSYMIKPGEFYGLKSAMSHYPREETAVAITDVVTVVLTESEFISLNEKNEELLLNILKALSKELRETVHLVNNMLEDKIISPEIGLYNYAQYYENAKEYNKSLYFYKKLLEIYPQTKYKSEAEEKISAINEQGQTTNIEDISVDSDQSIEEKTLIITDEPEQSENAGKDQKKYYEALTYFSSEHYDKAIKLFKDVVDSNDSSEEFRVKSLYEIGRILHKVKKTDNAETVFKKIINDYPNNELLKEVYFELSTIAIEKDDKDLSKQLLQKIIAIKPADNTTSKAKRLLSNIK